MKLLVAVLVFLNVYFGIALPPPPFIDDISVGALKALSFAPIRHFFQSLTPEQQTFVVDVMTRDTTIRQMLATAKAEQPGVYRKALDEIAATLDISEKELEVDQILDKIKQKIPPVAKAFVDEAHDTILNIKLSGDDDYNREQLQKAAKKLHASYIKLDADVRKKIGETYPKVHEMVQSKTYQDLLKEN